MQQQARHATAFSPQRKPLAKRQHIGRQTTRQLGQHPVQAANLKSDLRRRECVESSSGGHDDELAEIKPEAVKP